MARIKAFRYGIAGTQHNNLQDIEANAKAIRALSQQHLLQPPEHHLIWKEWTVIIKVKNTFKLKVSMLVLDNLRHNPWSRKGRLLPKMSPK